jgi:hypothetical protein
MLITSAQDQVRQHVEAREGLVKHFNELLEDILNANSHKDKYWILGKTRVEKHHGKDVVRPFLQACEEKPGIIKESFVYEVDNRRGVKTLLWVMHPGDVLSFPTLGKSIRVSNEKGGIILPPKLGRKKRE